MRVKILEKDDRRNLEEEINSFLKNQEQNNVIDIKYSGSGCHAPYGTSYYSAMIILKE